MKIHVGNFGGGGKKPKISTDFYMCVVVICKTRNSNSLIGGRHNEKECRCD